MRSGDVMRYPEDSVMAKSQVAWEARQYRRALREAKRDVGRMTVEKVMSVSRASTKTELELVPTAALIRHARTSAGVDQWDVFTALKVPGAIWRAFEAGERPMPRPVWERFQSWLKERAA